MVKVWIGKYEDETYLVHVDDGHSEPGNELVIPATGPNSAQDLADGIVALVNNLSTEEARRVDE